MSTPQILTRLLIVGFFSLTLAACSSSSSPTPATPADEDPAVVPPVVPPVNTPVDTPVDTPAESDPTGLISEVSIGDMTGTYYLGTPPAQVGSIVLNALSDGEALSVISGGSSELAVTADQPYSTVYVLSDDGGYFQVQLDEATTSSDLVLTYSTLQIDGEQVDIGVQVADAGGAISAQQPVALTSVVVGTGDLQVSVSWDQATDVDLYLTEPDETVIYFGSDSSAAGGELDLDSNAGCDIDNVNNENITYDGAVPPSGEYIVALDYYDSCDIATPTSFVVTVRANGTVRTFSGQFVAGDDFLMRREITRVIVQ